MQRFLFIALPVVLFLVGLATVVHVGVKASIRKQYLDLRSGQAGGRNVVAVDQRTFEDWKVIASSKEWEVYRTADDVFSLSFQQLPDAGFTPDINGYLDLWAAELPPPEGLSLFELIRLRHAAALRMVLAPPVAGNIHIFESGGVIQGFSLPVSNREKLLHLGMLENGKYAEYVASRRSFDPATSEFLPATGPTLESTSDEKDTALAR